MFSPSLSLAIVFILRLAALCMNAAPVDVALARLGDVIVSCDEDAVREFALPILRIFSPIAPNVDSGVLERVEVREVAGIARIWSGVNEDALVLPFIESLECLLWLKIAIASLYLK